MKQFVIALSLTVVMVFGLLALYSYLHRRERRINAQLHAISAQRDRLKDVLKCFDWMVIQDASVLSNFNSGEEYSIPQILEITSKTKKADIIMHDIHDGKDLLDIWGNASRFRFEVVDTNQRTAKITAWSRGPNGFDENGKGDDVVVSDVIGWTP